MSESRFQPFETQLDQDAALAHLRMATAGAEDGEAGVHEAQRKAASDEQHLTPAQVDREYEQRKPGRPEAAQAAQPDAEDDGEEKKKDRFRQQQNARLVDELAAQDVVQRGGVDLDARKHVVERRDVAHRRKRGSRVAVAFTV